MFHKVYVEISDICSFSCAFCPSPKGVRGVMPLELFDVACVQLKHLTRCITLHLLGDPLTRPNLVAYLDIALSHGLFVEIVTAGANLAKHEVTLKTHTAIRQINFSLGAHNANSSQLESLFDFSLAHHSNCFINLRLWGDFPEIRALLEHRFGVTLSLPKMRARIAQKTILDIAPSFHWPKIGASTIEQNGFCHGLSSHFGILSDGRVVPCCLDSEGIITLGNIQEEAITTILKSQRALKIVQDFKSQKASELLCQYCDYKKIVSQLK